MSFIGNKAWSALASLALVGVLAGCGISKYPGQPNLKTNGYSKIDMENLEGDGLYVYEASYDNTPGGGGVAAVITKRYPGAQTWTSNVRTGEDGSVYRVKSEYKGARVEMMAFPSINQIMMPADSSVEFFNEYDYSLNEIDSRNLAEENYFSSNRGMRKLNQAGLISFKQKLQAIMLGKPNVYGGLTYEVVSIDLDGKNFKPTKVIQIKTNLFQSAFNTNVTGEIRRDVAGFIERNFPKGFKGNVTVHLTSGEKLELKSPGRIHTPATAKAAGVNVVIRSRLELDELAKKFSN